MHRPAIALASILTISQPVFAQVPASPVAPDAAAVTPATRQDARDPADDTSFPSLIRGLGRSFRALPSLENAAILGIGGGVSLALHSEDAQVTRHFITSPALDALFEPGEGFGGGAVQVGSAIGVYALGRGLHSPRVSLLGADLVRSQIMNTVLTQGIKVAVGRRRPDGGAFSFPSGHTSSSVATATVLQRHLGWRVGIPAYALAAFVAGSRVQENRHYLSDVIFGAAVGLVSGRTTTIGRGPARFAVSPFATTGGGGVAFSLVPTR